MTTLLFLLTVLTLLILLVIVIVRAIGGKPVWRLIKFMAFTAAGYLILWTAFYLKSSLVTVPLGTEVCFDDWCATVTKTERISLHPEALKPSSDSVTIVLHIKVSNQARGIAQKPSEPRIHIIDGRGRYWPPSVSGQRALEVTAGKQKDIGSRLELGQSLETELVYILPVNAAKLRALIEEGPFITKLLLPEDQQVFVIR